MTPKGVQNAEAIIGACNKALTDLGEQAEPECKELLTGVVTTLETMKTRFFLKTNLAIPVTNACRKDAADLQTAADGGDLSGVADALARFRTSADKLFKQAKMDGIALT
jgi:hypothetical protein